MPSELTEALQNAALADGQRNILWALVDVHDTSDQTTSSWTGFNMLTSEQRGCTLDAIGYLPTIAWKHLNSTVRDNEADDGELPFDLKVIAERSINKVCDGEQCNRAVRLHKLT